MQQRGVAWKATEKKGVEFKFHLLFHNLRLEVGLKLRQLGTWQKSKERKGAEWQLI